MITAALLARGLLAALIVGFVTSSIRSWIDRVFLVIMLAGIVGLPIKVAIQVNLIVLALAALFHVLRNGKSMKEAVPPGSHEWLMIVVSAILGGIAGRMLFMAVAPRVLLAVLGVYAVLVGLRILFIKPVPEKPAPAHAAFLAPVSLAGGVLTGLLSAGGKPFMVPAYNYVMGHHPKRAYVLASLGVVAGALASVAVQLVLPGSFTLDQFLFAAYEFAIVTAVALVVNRFWTEKLARIVNLSIVPILMLVGTRFLMTALR